MKKYVNLKSVLLLILVLILGGIQYAYLSAVQRQEKQNVETAFKLLHEQNWGNWRVTDSATVWRQSSPSSFRYVRFDDETLKAESGDSIFFVPFDPERDVDGTVLNGLLSYIILR